jgi:hypothetical protein
MNDEQFKDAVAWFRSSIRHQGDQAEIPEIQAIRNVGRTSRSAWDVLVPRKPAGRPAADREVRPTFLLRWVIAVVGVLILGAISVSYERTREQQRAAEQAREDTLLLEKINAGISRTVPRSMEPLLGLGEIR